MIIIVLAEEMDRALGMTLGAINECGFETMVVDDRGLDRVAEGKAIIIGRHPRKRHNGESMHRRRFALYRYRGFRAVGYAAGAECDIDCLWWRDLFYKLRHLIENGAPESERLDLVVPLERLREMGQ